jgi:DNA-binding GntR family transcriptional regulator
VRREPPAPRVAAAGDADPEPGAIRPPTISDAVLQEMRVRLIRRRYEPGDRLRVDQLAGEFGVSALPVREAMRVLLAEGRVQYESHRGYRVSELTFEDVEEIFLMCRVLEGEAVRRGVPKLTETEVERMSALLAQLVSPSPSASVWDIAANHQDFHFVPIEAARLPRIEAELHRLWDHTDHYRGLYLFVDDELMQAMHEEHAALAAACAARDADEVVRLMDAHRQHALASLEAHLGRGGP